jgi:S-adenosylmethionine:tRNA ribosyltransferase-isomerase
MKITDFQFDLPEALIAQFPAEARTQSRLLMLNGHTGELKDAVFPDILDVITDKDLLVFNNTKSFLHVCLDRKTVAVKWKCW